MILCGMEKKLAEKIAQGNGLADSDVVVKLYNIAKSDESDVITEIFKSKKVIVGDYCFFY